MITLRRLLLNTVLVTGLGGALWGCPGAGVDSPPPDPLKTDGAVDAGPADAEPLDAAPPDAETVLDAEPVDAEPVDTGFKLRAADFAPASETAGSAEHQLRGSFGASSPSGASSDRHQLRGSLGPLSPPSP